MQVVRNISGIILGVFLIDLAGLIIGDFWSLKQLFTNFSFHQSSDLIYQLLSPVRFYKISGLDYFLVLGRDLIICIICILLLRKKQEMYQFKEKQFHMHLGFSLTMSMFFGASIINILYFIQKIPEALTGSYPLEQLIPGAYFLFLFLIAIGNTVYLIIAFSGFRSPAIFLGLFIATSIFGIMHENKYLTENPGNFNLGLDHPDRIVFYFYFISSLVTVYLNFEKVRAFINQMFGRGTSGR